MPNARRPLGLAEPAVPAGYGFRASGGVPAKCACDAGYGWQKDGDHPCGCKGRAQETRLAEGVPLRAAIGARNAQPAWIGMASTERVLLSGVPHGECAQDCCCCIEGMEIRDQRPIIEGGYFKQPFNVIVKSRVLGARSNEVRVCQYEWWEARRKAVAGVPSWSGSTWNGMHEIPRKDAFATRNAWLRQQRTSCSRGEIGVTKRIIGEDAPGMPIESYSLMLTEPPVLIFVRMLSGCEDPTQGQECKSRCAVMRVMFGTPTPIIDVIELMKGQCAMPKLALDGSGLVDVQATWRRIRENLTGGSTFWRMSGGQPG